jgi:hypothetical protein
MNPRKRKMLKQLRIDKSKQEEVQEVVIVEEKKDVAKGIEEAGQVEHQRS